MLDGKGGVWVGGDSAGVAGYAMSVRADEKVFRNGPYVMGFTTSFRMGQLLRFALRPPKPPPKSWPADRHFGFMCNEFVDAVRECLAKGGFKESKEGAEKGGTFVVGYEGRLFTIEPDFQVAVQRDAFCAVGCGQQIALGAMYAMSAEKWFKCLLPRKRILIALAAAEHYSAGVRRPFKVLHA